MTQKFYKDAMSKFKTVFVLWSKNFQKYNTIICINKRLIFKTEQQNMNNELEITW